MSSETPGPPGPAALPESEETPQDQASPGLWTKLQSVLNNTIVQSVLLLGVVLLVYNPLLKTSALIESHDLFFHQRRSVEYLTAIQHSPNMLPIWSENAMGGTGRPFFLYAAPFVQWSTAGLIALTGNSVVAIHMLALLLALLGAIGVLLWLRQVSPPHAAFLATLSFVGTDYIVRNILARGALAEVAAMAFFTLVLWLTERYLRTGRVMLLGWASLAFTFVVLAHNLSMIYLAPTIFVYSLFGGWRYGQWKRAFLGLIIPIVGMSIAAFFWIPAVVHSEWIDKKQFVSGFSDIRRHFLHAGDIFRLGYTSLVGKANRRFLSVFWTLSSVLSLFLFFFTRNKPKEMGRFVFTLTIGVGACLFFLSNLSQLIWTKVPYLKFVQFPWRLMVICSLFCAGISVYLFSRLEWKLSHVLIAGVVIIPPIGTATHFGLQTPREDRIHLETSKLIREKKTVSFGYVDESAPKCVRRGVRPIITPKTLFRPSKGVKVSKMKIRYAWRQAHYESKKGGTIILRNAYFPLWNITANGKPLKFKCIGIGFMKFKVPPGKGVIQANLEPSPLMVGTRWFSFTLFALFLGLMGVSWRKSWTV